MAKTPKGAKGPESGKIASFIDGHYNLVAHIFLAHQALSKARESQLREIGITYVEFQLLWAVEGLGDSATPAEISRMLMRRPPTMSALLNRMEKNKLVKRTQNRCNKKLKKVVMTEKGRKALRLARKDDIIHAIIGSMPEKDLNQLYLLLIKLKDTARSFSKRMKTSE